MTSTNNKNILDLETLNAQYDNLLIQYRQAVANYVSYLKKTDSKTTFINVKGQAFWGSGQAGKQAAYTDIKDVNSCAALCSKTPNCSGATFNPNKFNTPICQLRKGNGKPVVSSPDDYAIVPEEREILFNIQYLNGKLKSVNKKILNLINNNIPSYESQITERTEKNNVLLANYEKLNQERIKIDNMVKEYESLDFMQNEGELSAYSYYYYFLFLIVFFILIIILLYKFGMYLPYNTYTSDNDSFSIEKLFMMIFIIVFFIIIYYLFVNKKTNIRMYINNLLH